MTNPHLRQASNSVQVREPKSFGKRREPTSIAVMRNGRTSLFTVRPVLAAMGFGVFCMFAVGYFAATAYLVLRDDLIGMTQARSARLLHEYEDRIAMLRSNLDRVTSRQLLDQRAIEAKVAELMQRQEMLSTRSGRVGKLIDTARQFGIEPDTEENPADSVTTGSVSSGTGDSSSLGGFELRGSTSNTFAAVLPGKATIWAQTPAPDIANYAETQNLFQDVLARIETVNGSQRKLLDGLRRQASEKTGKIAKVLSGLALQDEAAWAQAIGGPHIPVDPANAFDAHVDALDASLALLTEAKKTIAQIPVANPVKGAPLSSPFGLRSDPFLGHESMHSGLDFKASTGAPVHAAADGKVIDAGRNGSYGNMVEIDHGNGIVTRYAHLSKITLNSGDRIRRGEKVGEVGSTGRSTGPHLHYEIRRHGQAVNPISFLKAGRSIASSL